MNDEAFVIDASIAVKWFIWEDGTDKALDLLDYIISFYAPSFFLMEIDSVITKKVRQRELQPDEASIKRKQFRNLPYKLIAYADTENFAFDLSTKLPISLYDANYLAVAIDRDAKLYTADIHFYNAVSSTPFKKYIEKIDY